MRYSLALLAAGIAVTAPASAGEIVPLPAFRSIELRGGGGVTILPGAVQRVTLVQGSSQFTQLQVDRNGKLTIANCAVRCPINYRSRIEIRTPNLFALAIRGGGAITAAKGFAPQSELAVAVSGGGAIDTGAVQSDTATAAVNGGGDIKLAVRRSLTAAVKGGGLIRYWGRPQLTTAIHGGGAVTPGF